MADIITQEISSLPVVAGRYDSDFISTAEDFLNTLPNWATELNTWADQANVVGDAVNNVSDIKDEIIAVDANKTNIDTVATNIDNVNKVGAIDTDVTTVASNDSNVTTVATNIIDVNTTATNITDVNTVANNDTNITTVATNITDVNTVASNDTNITTVATNITDVNTVASNDTNITTVATSIDNVNTTATNITDVNTVASNDTNITTVATNITDVNTTAINITDVITVANNDTNITTVATNIDNVNITAGSIDNVNTYAKTYYGALDADPTTRPDGSDLQIGDLYFNTTIGMMKVYNGTTWQLATSAVNGMLKKVSFTGDGTTTSFTVTDGYDANFGEIFLNGVNVTNDVDLSDGQNIVFITAPADGDEILGVFFGFFVLADCYTKAEADQTFVNVDDYEDADVLNKIKNVDGAGSGLDADLLKGRTNYLTTDNLFYAVDEKASGTNGGFAATGENIRDINTVLVNNINAVLDTNTITVEPGEYYIEAISTVYRANNNKLYIKDTNSNILLSGISNYYTYGYYSGGMQYLGGIVSLSETTSFNVISYVNEASDANTLGLSTRDGTPEKYTYIKIWRLD